MMKYNLLLYNLTQGYNCKEKQDTVLLEGLANLMNN